MLIRVLLFKSNEKKSNGCKMSTISRNFKAQTDTRLVFFPPRLTSRLTSYDSQTPDILPGMDLFCLWIFNVFNKCLKQKERTWI